MNTRIQEIFGHTISAGVDNFNRFLRSTGVTFFDNPLDFVMFIKNNPAVPGRRVQLDGQKGNIKPINPSLPDQGFDCLL